MRTVGDDSVIVEWDSGTRSIVKLSDIVGTPRYYDIVGGKGRG